MGEKEEKYEHYSETVCEEGSLKFRIDQMI